MPLFKKDGTRLKAKEFVEALKLSGSEGEENGVELLRFCAKETMEIQDVILSQVESDVHGLKDPLECVFYHLGTPLDLRSNRAQLQFSASTSQYTTMGSLKLLIPALISNIVKERQDTTLVENVNDLIASNTKVSGNEMITEVVYDKATEDAYDSFIIPEGGRIPVRTIQATNQSIRFYKIGSGIEFTYEAGRRISLARIMPHIERQKFQRTQAEARLAVKTLLEGDGVHGGATAVSVNDFDSNAVLGSLNGNSKAFIAWLINASKKGRPIDTIVVNYDSLIELGNMFPVYKETANGGVVQAVGVGNLGTSTVGMKVSVKGGLDLNIKIVVSSEMLEGAVLGYRKSETLERFEEINSSITEQERTIRNQVVSVVNTINVGFAIAYGESREVLHWL